MFFPLEALITVPHFLNDTYYYLQHMFLITYLLSPSSEKAACFIQTAVLAQQVKVSATHFSPKMYMVEKKASSHKFSSELHMHTCTHI